MPWRISSSLYSDAIPTARRELDAIGAIDAELSGLGPEQLQAPIETRRKAVGPDALPEDGSLPVKKADGIEYDTELLREKTITRFGVGLSIEAALRRQRRLPCPIAPARSPLTRASSPNHARNARSFRTTWWY